MVYPFPNITWRGERSDVGSWGTFFNLPSVYTQTLLYKVIETLSFKALPAVGRRWGIVRGAECWPRLCAPSRHYAARKGTREKAKKKKVKVEVKKASFVPHALREKQTTEVLKSKRLSDEYKRVPVDDVWVARFHKWRIFDFDEAVECHRETHHPQIYNLPNAPLNAFIELDMRTAKKTKFVDTFSRIAKIDNAFPHGEERAVLVFCKTPELKEEAESAGANLVGDVDILKKIEKGDIVLPDFQFVVAHPNILPELVSLRGLLKKKFPNPKLGTLGTDLAGMVKNIKTGIQYWAFRDEVELDYGWVDTVIGTLDMETEQLEANLKALIEDISSMRPKREGPFITRILLKSAPSVEKLKLNLEPYLPEEFKKDNYASDSDNEEEIQKKSV
ncbi:hypothetical protein AAG570_005972 [Ranatra chinensis]|uniref:39S ribosomal protein L1, mitochondrial n=1 Tax=Ranatra chinensis TaxID=642074 RepID=A0ABD0XWN4_9HEMI